jgi:hypothetical protein
MAQFLYKDIEEDGGGDYTTLEACLDDNEQDLTGDGWFDIEIKGEWDNPDTTAVTINNYTTTADDYINIYTSGAARHSGTVGAKNYRIIFQTDYTEAIRNTEPYTTVDGIILSATGYSSDCYYQGGDDPEHIVKKCILYDCGNRYGSPTEAGIWAEDVSSNVTDLTAFANIIYDVGSGIRHEGYDSADCWIYNNSIYNAGNEGIDVDNYTTHSGQNVKNNLCIDCGTDYDLGNATVATNGSGDTTGSAGLQNLTADTEWVTPGTDMHIEDTGAISCNAGTDLGSDYEQDIDDDTRSGDWELGADERAGCTPGVQPSGVSRRQYQTTNKGYL